MVKLLGDYSVKTFINRFPRFKRWINQAMCIHNFEEAHQDGAVYLEICTKCGQWLKHGS